MKISSAVVSKYLEKSRLLFRLKNSLIYQQMKPFLESFAAPVPALPLDLFRILVGLLGVVYFCDLFLQTNDISSPDGFLDHEMIQELFWFTRISLFQPGLSTTSFQFVFLASAAISCLLIVGIWVKPAAFFLYLIAVSNYRWNFLVMYVEDVVMHLVFFWLILLPVGQTLNLDKWLKRKQAVFDEWRQTEVSGVSVRCFLINLAFIYLVAGLWKWHSPMWRDGTALYAILKLPAARWPDFLQPEHLPLLRLMNYITLIMEPLLALLIVAPARHRIKWVLWIGMLGFHFGIILTMKVPYANVAMLATSAILFRDELQGFFNGPNFKKIALSIRPRLSFADKFSLFSIVLLGLAFIWQLNTTPWRKPDSQVSNQNVALEYVVNPWYAPLWAMGLAQNYRLFDWIDDRNFHVRYLFWEIAPNGEESLQIDDSLFPDYPRSTLLQTYLHDVTWIRVPDTGLLPLKRDLYQRFIRRYCETHPQNGQYALDVVTQRITADNLLLDQGVVEREVEFRCINGRVDWIQITP